MIKEKENQQDKTVNPRLGRPVEILLVEDNPGDVILTEIAFKESKIANNLYVARDGEQAIEYLKQNSGFEGAVKPDLILLDLNMPKKNGREVLAEVKSDENLKNIPVVVMTSSMAESDILQSYNLHANSYVVKPVNLEKLAEVIESIENFWFTVVILPSEQSKQYGHHDSKKEPEAQAQIT